MPKSRPSASQIFEAVRLLVRYAAAVARAEQQLDTSTSKIELAVAEALAQAMAPGEAQDLVTIASRVEARAEEDRLSLRIAAVARDLIAEIEKLRENRSAQNKREFGPGSPTVVRAVTEKLAELCKYWDVPTGTVDLKQLSERVLGPRNENRQAHVACVLAQALAPDLHLGARTVNGLLAALGGNEQDQGRIKTEVYAVGALNSEPVQRDIALFAMTVAFPGVTIEEAEQLVDAARARLTALQPAPETLQPTAASSAIAESGAPTNADDPAE